MRELVKMSIHKRHLCTTDVPAERHLKQKSQTVYRFNNDWGDWATHLNKPIGEADTQLLQPLVFNFQTTPKTHPVA